MCYSLDIGFPGPSSKGPICQCRRQETQVLFLGWEDPVDNRMATHSSVLAWRIPWTEEPGGLQSIGLHRVRHDWGDLARTHAHTHWVRERKEKYDFKVFGRRDWQDGSTIKNEKECSGKKVKVAQSYPTLCDPMDSPWYSLGQNTGVGSHSLLQGIFPAQGLNTGLPYCGQILYQLSHRGSQRIVEWVAYPFSRGSSQPRNQTGVSCIAGGFFTFFFYRKENVTLNSIDNVTYQIKTGTYSHYL